MHRRLSSTKQILIFLLVALSCSSVAAQESKPGYFIRPIVGSRMVVGEGEVKKYTVKCFLHLCNKSLPNVVLVRLNDSSRIKKATLKKYGAGSVLVMDSITDDPRNLTMQMIDADGVWIEGDSAAIEKNRLLVALLKNVTQRNGVVAVSSSSVSLLPLLDDEDQEKRIRSPLTRIAYHFGKRSSARKDRGKDSHLKVHWAIPNSSTLVIHRGRWFAGYGYQDVRVTVKEANGWPERTGSIESPDVFSPGSYPFRGQDLFSWVRSAKERGGPVFPPKTISDPVVRKGTVFLHGGSGVTKEVMQEFIRIAGGKQSSFVCIPSAQRFDRPEFARSHSAEILRELGVKGTQVLHTVDPVLADQREEFADLLKNADAVWIDGGRTYRLMDSFEGTRVEKLIAKVLERGGVVGGSSAGCQVAGEFLVRGNPRTNRDMVFPGYTRGMNLLPGVMIDAHFLQRDRHEPFLNLIKKHPQLLGIGIDERTALVVKGQVGRVLGEAKVSFYDLRSGGKSSSKPVILKSGESYDLKRRKKLKN